jgi:hypothetical protein
MAGEIGRSIPSRTGVSCKFRLSRPVARPKEVSLTADEWRVCPSGT